MAENIIQKNALSQYTEDMQRYGIYVSRKRATPSLLDGLKPVHRRIIYCMYNDIHATSFSNRTKSASIVGRTMEKYHPHGDAGIYGAFKPLINDFECKSPLINGEGNFGNFQGDPSAASRYTQAFLSPFAMECVISDLVDNKNTVDWIDTYNEQLEPEYLPVKVPLLLVNGSFGIGVGMKVDIPTHNLSEVIDQTINLIKNPNSNILLIPDHCMPCEIFETDFEDIGNKGFGSYGVRGIIDIDEFEGKQCLVIKSTPNITFLDTITEKIENLVASNKIIQIQNVFDKSTVDQMRYIIVLKKGSDPQYVRDVIYKNTSMEQKCRVNFEVLDGLNPIRMSYKNYLLSFIEQRKITKHRLYYNEMQKVQTNKHEKEAFITLIKSGEIDNVVTMIKTQKNTDDSYLVEYLVTKLKITDIQARYILNSNIKKLAIGNLKKYNEDLLVLKEKEDIIRTALTDDSYIINEIITELSSVKKKYGKPRTSKIIMNPSKNGVPNGEFKVVITTNNYIKKIPINDNIGSLKGDRAKKILNVENTQNILIFDDKGKVFKLPVNRIPFTDKSSAGVDIRMILKNLTSNITNIIYEPILLEFNKLVDKFYLVVVTSRGYAKRMEIEEFLSVNVSGLVYSKLEDGDYVVSVDLVWERSDVLIYSNKSTVRIPALGISCLNRTARGTNYIDSNELVDGTSFINANTTDIVVVTNRGNINRFSVNGLPVSKTKKPSKVIKLSKTDGIKSILGVNSNDNISIESTNGIQNIFVQDIPEGSSIGNGNKMINMNNGNIILKCEIVK